MSVTDGRLHDIRVHPDHVAPMRLTPTFGQLFDRCAALHGSGVRVSTRVSWDRQAWRVLPYYQAHAGAVTGGGRSPEQAMRVLYEKLSRRARLRRP